MADHWSLLLMWLSLCALALVNVGGVRLLRSHSAFRRLLAVDDLGSIVPSYDLKGKDVLAGKFQGSNYRELLQQVMNLVGKCEPADSADPLAVLHHVRRGGGPLLRKDSRGP